MVSNKRRFRHWCRNRFWFTGTSPSHVWKDVLSQVSCKQSRKSSSFSSLPPFSVKFSYLSVSFPLLYKDFACPQGPFFINKYLEKSKNKEKIAEKGKFLRFFFGRFVFFRTFAIAKQSRAESSKGGERRPSNDSGHFLCSYFRGLQETSLHQ